VDIMTKKELNTIKKIGNAIISRYTKSLITYTDMQNMYTELNQAGISTGMIYNGQKTCEWYYNDVQIEDSLFYYSIYKVENKIELNCYLT